MEQVLIRLVDISSIHTSPDKKIDDWEQGARKVVAQKLHVRPSFRWKRLVFLFEVAHCTMHAEILKARVIRTLVV